MSSGGREAHPQAAVVAGRAVEMCMAAEPAAVLGWEQFLGASWQLGGMTPKGFPDTTVLGFCVFVTFS